MVEYYRLKSLSLLWILLLGSILIESVVGSARPVLAQEHSNSCPVSKGFWKNHPSAWPISLTIGSQVYSQSELLSLLRSAPRGDASIILARQQIAALLNLANGADPEPIGRMVDSVQSMLTGFRGKLPFETPPSSQQGQEMIAASELLDSYNQGDLTPHCARVRHKDVGSISGMVIDANSGRPIEGAAVLATLGGMPQREATTDANGLYAMLGMMSGAYALEAAAAGFEPAFQRDVAIAAREHATVNFALRPEAPTGGPPTAVACWTELGGNLVCSDPNTASVPPLTDVQLNGLQSFDPDRDALSYAWRVAVAPAGSNSRISDIASPLPNYFLDLAGDYLVCLTVTDATGLSSPEACVTIHASTVAALEIQLIWDTARSDLDLHFLHPNGGWGDLEWDCHYLNRTPSWGARLDLDDRDGFGPENISLAQPEDVTYKVGAHYFGDQGGGSTIPTIRIIVNGSLAYEKAGSALPAAGYFWEAAEISWSRGSATITEVDIISPTIP